MTTHREPPVLVLGGTGHYGRQIVRALLERGQPVRVLTRSASNARRVLGAGAELLEGDITHRASIDKALQGVVSVVISISAFSPKLIRQTKQIERDAVLAVLEGASAAGIDRAVYISVYEIRQEVVDELSFDTARLKGQVEDALTRSDLNWTVLGAAPSMELFFSLIRGERLMVPGGGSPSVPTVAPADVGQIAAQAAWRDDLASQRFRMVGPAAISFSEAARRISAVTGRPLHLRAIPLLPLRIAAAASRPFYPYLHALVSSMRLLHSFPPDIVAQVAQDHQRLLDTFEYTPTTLEMQAQRWMARRGGGSDGG